MAANVCLNAPACGNSTCPATLSCIPIAVSNLLGAAMAFVGITTVFLIIYAGIRFIFSRGDSKQLEEARKVITYAIIGLVTVLFSFFIINLIGRITGVTCLAQFTTNIQNFSFTACQ